MVSLRFLTTSQLAHFFRQLCFEMRIASRKQPHLRFLHQWWYIKIVCQIWIQTINCWPVQKFALTNDYFRDSRFNDRYFLDFGRCHDVILYSEISMSKKNVSYITSTLLDVYIILLNVFPFFTRKIVSNFFHPHLNFALSTLLN